MPRVRVKREPCDCFDCLYINEESSSLGDAAARQTPPPRCLIIYGADLVVRGNSESGPCSIETESYPHLEGISRDGWSGMLALQAGGSCETVKAMQLDALAQLLGVSKEYRESLLNAGDQAAFTLGSIADRFRKMSGGMMSNNMDALSLATRVGMTYTLDLGSLPVGRAVGGGRTAAPRLPGDRGDGQGGRRDGQDGRNDDGDGRRDGQDGRRDGQDGRRNGQGGRRNGQGGRRDGRRGRREDHDGGDDVQLHAGRGDGEGEGDSCASRGDDEGNGDAHAGPGGGAGDGDAHAGTGDGEGGGDAHVLRLPDPALLAETIKAQLGFDPPPSSFPGMDLSPQGEAGQEDNTLDLLLLYISLAELLSPAAPADRCRASPPGDDGSVPGTDGALAPEDEGLPTGGAGASPTTHGGPAAGTDGSLPPTGGGVPVGWGGPSRAADDVTANRLAAPSFGVATEAREPSGVERNQKAGSKDAKPGILESNPGPARRSAPEGDASGASSIARDVNKGRLGVVSPQGEASGAEADADGCVMGHDPGQDDALGREACTDAARSVLSWLDDIVRHLNQSRAVYEGLLLVLLLGPGPNTSLPLPAPGGQPIVPTGLSPPCTPHPSVPSGGPSPAETWDPALDPPPVSPGVELPVFLSREPATSPASVRTEPAMTQGKGPAAPASVRTQPAMMQKKGPAAPACVSTEPPMMQGQGPAGAPVIRPDGVFPVQRPKQSFQFLGETEVAVAEGRGILRVDRLAGVIRRDAVTNLGVRECRENGAAGCVLAERLLWEVAYKMGRAPKYGS